MLVNLIFHWTVFLFVLLVGFGGGRMVSEFASSATCIFNILPFPFDLTNMSVCTILHLAAIPLSPAARRYNVFADVTRTEGLCFENENYVHCFSIHRFSFVGTIALGPELNIYFKRTSKLSFGRNFSSMSQAAAATLRSRERKKLFQTERADGRPLPIKWFASSHTLGSIQYENKSKAET